MAQTFEEVFGFTPSKKHDVFPLETIIVRTVLRHKAEKAYRLEREIDDIIDKHRTSPNSSLEEMLKDHAAIVAKSDEGIKEHDEWVKKYSLAKEALEPKDMRLPDSIRNYFPESNATTA